MRLIAVYNTFNEAQHLEESLKSIRDQVDFIVIVDGAYQKFPHEFPYSTDGTLKIARKYADKIIETTKPWKSEIFKKNHYLIGELGDFYFHIGGHEIWFGELKPPFGNYRVKVRMKGQLHEFFRMFEHQPGIRYERRHYELWVGDKCLGQEYLVYPHGHLIHKDLKYTKKLLRARKKYFSTPDFDN